MQDFKTVCQIKLVDGSVLNNCRCGYSENDLWCFLEDISFAEAFQYFSSPEKFSTVIFDMINDNVTNRVTYTGLTRIVNITQRTSTLIDVELDGPHVEVKTEQIVEESDQNNGTIHNPD